MKGIARLLIQVALIGLLVLVACPVSYGQTTVMVGPVTTSDKVEYIVAAASFNAVSQLQIRARDNATSGPFVQLPAPLSTECLGVAANAFKCSVNLPMELVDLLNVQGVHSLTLTAFDVPTGLESPSSLPFVLSTPPGAPTGVRIIR